MPRAVATGQDAPDIVLYTNKYCPSCRRVYITLTSLGLSYKEVHIDLDVPRPAWYLGINPNGKVPALEYNGTVVVESADIVSYLVDRHDSHLTKSNGSDIPRSEVDAFVDAFMADGAKDESQLPPATLFHHVLLVPDDASRNALIKQLAVVLKERIEPQLKNAAPYFFGSKELSLVEALCGPTLLLMANIPNALGWHDFEAEVSREAPASWRWIQVVAANPVINAGWEVDEAVRLFQEKVGQIRAQVQAGGIKP